MSASITGVIPTIEHYENSPFQKTGDSPFYYEAGTQTLNFGYGYNLSSGGTSATSALQGTGIPQSAIDYLNNKVGYDSAGRLKPTTKDDADALNEKLSGGDYRASADSLTRDFITNVESELSSPDGMVPNFYSLPTNVQAAIDEVAYNGGSMAPAFGPTFTQDIADGNYGAAAYELAYATATPGQDVYEGRNLNAAGQLLGYTTTIDPNTNAVTYSGTPDPTSVTSFLNAATSQNGAGSSFLNGQGFDLLNKAIGSEIDNINQSTDPSNPSDPSDPSNSGTTTDNNGNNTVYLNNGDGTDSISGSSSTGITTYTTTYSASSGGSSDSGGGDNGGGSGGGSGDGGGDAGSAGGDMGGGNNQGDPLLLDLTGKGINLIPLSSTSPYYDYTGTGFATKTGWTGSGTGFLSLYTPGTSTTEAKLKPLGANDSSSSGFKALQTLDSNNDGIINGLDSKWVDLRVWIDTNSNGIADPGETYTLDQLGIASISLSSSAYAQTIAGNELRRSAPTPYQMDRCDL